MYRTKLMKKVSFYTLGCKLNQAETAYLAGEFINRGYTIVSFGQPCDICVINTCTVTVKTDSKCRQIIRRAKKISPQATIAVVGCYAQTSFDELKNFPGVKLILGSDKKFDIFKYLDSKKVIQRKGKNNKYISAVTESFIDQTRSFLKIQDGCNNFCSYCIVPHVRGPSRSDAIENVVTNTTKLVEHGYKEIVLTGVHIGCYGHDFNPKLSLLELLKKLEKIPQLGRIRLSSLEPMELDEELINFIIDSDKICPHFHIPLQSGDDLILKRMKRNYTVSDYVKIIDRLITRVTHPGLGTDIIVGFPGETELQFNNTYRLIEDLPFTYLHVFSFSPRPGTEAAQFSDSVNPHTKKERSAKLIELSKQKKHNFYQQAITKKLNVLFEEKKNGKWMYGFTENYIRVKVEQQPFFFNKIVPVKLSGLNLNFALGEIAVADYY